MTETVQLPDSEPEYLNAYFQCELIEVPPHNLPLGPGLWIRINVGDFAGQSKSIGGIEVLHRLYQEGMDALATQLEHTIVLGVFGETDVSETLLRRMGYEIGYAGDYGRISYMSFEKFLQKPWRTSLLQLRRGST